ncbi:hypothetical protein HPB50_009306 [Hyalomma asiaticum]|uniref:Uncharacterized protein n=1 Tax=Hyalomma asiaticum TaxID=266040 RepID=A0ACB7TJS4_HYAAI|nr:hypothetical protein HPB50_009306 [Hyalomma asiaticum]
MGHKLMKASTVANAAVNLILISARSLIPIGIRAFVSPPASQPYQVLSNQKLSVQAKKVVHNVYAQVRKSDPQLSVRAACRKVSELTPVSERSVFWIKLDVNSGTLKSPKRKRLRLPAMDDRAKTGRTRLELHDSFSLEALRRKTHPNLDETWVNAGHTKDKVSEDANVTTREEAFRHDLTTGLRAPSGKGGRLILLHAGNNWLQACAHVKKIKEDFWQRVGLIDSKLDQLIIPLGSGSSTESDGSDSYMSELEYLTLMQPQP